MNEKPKQQAPIEYEGDYCIGCGPRRIVDPGQDYCRDCLTLARITRDTERAAAEQARPERRYFV